jgi:hypothetical protein
MPKNLPITTPQDTNLFYYPILSAFMAYSIPDSY